MATNTEIAKMVNALVVARDMEKKQRAGEAMSADWSKATDDAVAALATEFPLLLAMADES